MNATETARAADKNARPSVSEPAELDPELHGGPQGERAAIDNAQTGALGLRDYLGERLANNETLRDELRLYLAASKAQHEELFGEITDSARFLELSCDWFSGWAGSKLGQF